MYLAWNGVCAILNHERVPKPTKGGTVHVYCCSLVRRAKLKHDRPNRTFRRLRSGSEERADFCKVQSVTGVADATREARGS